MFADVRVGSQPNMMRSNHDVRFSNRPGIVLATLNWRNSPLGFWCNAVVLGVGDIPFILLVLVPGYVPVWPGIAGPVLWIAGLACTAIAQVPMSGTVSGAKLAR